MALAFASSFPQQARFLKQPSRSRNNITQHQLKMYRSSPNTSWYLAQGPHQYHQNSYFNRKSYSPPTSHWPRRYSKCFRNHPPAPGGYYQREARRSPEKAFPETLDYGEHNVTKLCHPLRRVSGTGLRSSEEEEDILKSEQRAASKQPAISPNSNKRRYPNESSDSAYARVTKRHRTSEASEISPEAVVAALGSQTELSPSSASSRTLSGAVPSTVLFKLSPSPSPNTTVSEPAPSPAKTSESSLNVPCYNLTCSCHPNGTFTEMKFYHGFSQRLEDEIASRSESKINAAAETLISIQATGRRMEDLDEEFLDQLRKEARWEVRDEEYMRLGEEKLRESGVVRGMREKGDEWEKKVLEMGEEVYEKYCKSVLCEIRTEMIMVEKSWN